MSFDISYVLCGHNFGTFAQLCTLMSLDEKLLQGEDGEFVLILEGRLALWLKLNCIQSALFNFQSLLLVILLLICTSTYLHNVFPGIMDRNKDGYGHCWSSVLIYLRDVKVKCEGSSVSFGSLLEWENG